MKTRNGLILSLLAGLLLLALLAIGGLGLQPLGAWLFGADLRYQGRTIITGQRDETRLPGFEAALLDVAKKLSGNQALRAEDVASVVHGNIKLYVERFSDHDRMEDIPIHDEQGTRDRSFELLVDFVPRRVDALLKVLGEKPWALPRPKVLVLLRVENAASRTLLSSDEDDARGAEQRAAFAAVAWQVGLPLLLPGSTDLEKFNLTAENFDEITREQKASLANSMGADTVITGHLHWVGGAAGWRADWAMENAGMTHHWNIENINFDGAFRNALRGAAQILSHHGEPPPNLN